MVKKIIVIGSGFGGLAASLRVKAKGYDVTLLEKHPDLGGRARVFKKGNFIYDGGPTVITAPYLFEELFSLFNKKITDYVKIVPLDLWYRFVFSDGQTFDYSGNEKSMEKEVKKFSDQDFEGYNNLVNFTEKIFNKGFTDLSDKPFNNITFMLKQVPSLLSLKSYNINLDRPEVSPYSNALSIGLDLETGGHVFQLIFSNTQSIDDLSVLLDAEGSWKEGDIFFGFNILRIF